MSEFVLGTNAKLYYGAAGGSASTEMGNVKDVTLTLEAGEADVTTRANLGWRATAPTLRECTAEFEMVWDPTDAGFSAIKNAFLTAGLVALKILDQAGGQGPDGDFAMGPNNPILASTPDGRVHGPGHHSVLKDSARRHHGCGAARPRRH